MRPLPVPLLLAGPAQVPIRQGVFVDGGLGGVEIGHEATLARAALLPLMRVWTSR